MRDYGSDKPELRFDMKIQDVSEIFRHCKNYRSLAIALWAVVRRERSLYRCCGPFAQILRRTRQIYQTPRCGWNGMGRFPEGGEVKGSIAKRSSAARNSKASKRLPGWVEGCAVMMIVGADHERTLTYTGRLRVELGQQLELCEPDTFRFCWIVDFPMYEYNEDEERVDFSHNPFSMPQGGMQALEEKEPLDILGLAV